MKVCVGWLRDEKEKKVLLIRCVILTRRKAKSITQIRNKKILTGDA
jgi:hypothetical protein